VMLSAGVGRGMPKASVAGLPDSMRRSRTFVN